ncbi:MAG: glycosyltransferase family 2 protein [Ruminococcus sp.]
MCKVSVIVPVYKTDERSLRRCLDGLTAQTLQDIEIIVVDDGSPDSCGSICGAYADKYPCLTVIHQENGGVSAARNTGLRAASGEYIGFADADDYMEPDMYEAMYCCASSYHADILTTGYFKEKNGVSEKCGCTEEEQLTAEDALKAFLLCGKVDFTVWNKLFSRACIENLRFEAGQPIGEDKYFIFQALRQASCVVCSDICKYVYVLGDHSAMRSGYNRKKLSSIYFADKIDEEMKAYPESFAYYAMYARSKTYIRNWAAINRDVNSGEFREESRKLREYLKTVPLSFVKNYKSRKEQMTFLGLRLCPHITAFLLKKIYNRR